MIKSDYRGRVRMVLDGVTRTGRVTRVGSKGVTGRICQVTLDDKTKCAVVDYELTPISDPPTIDQLLQTARNHGHESDDPGHETGDLQDLLRTCFEVMTEEQRQVVIERHRDWYETWAMVGAGAKRAAEKSR